MLPLFFAIRPASSHWKSFFEKSYPENPVLVHTAIHYKGERRPITLELQEREEHLRAARNYGEEAEEKDRDEGEGRDPTLAEALSFST